MPELPFSDDFNDESIGADWMTNRTTETAEGRLRISGVAELYDGFARLANSTLGGIGHGAI